MLPFKVMVENFSSGALLQALRREAVARATGMMWMNLLVALVMFYSPVSLLAAAIFEGGVPIPNTLMKLPDNTCCISSAV